MLSLDEIVTKAKGNLRIHKDYRLKTEKDLMDKLIICVPDMHLLERGPNDDFLDNKSEHEKRFLSLLDFLLELKFQLQSPLLPPD